MPQSSARKYWWLLRRWCHTGFLTNEQANVFFGNLTIEGNCRYDYRFNDDLQIANPEEFTLTPYDVERWHPGSLKTTEWFNDQQKYYETIYLGKNTTLRLRFPFSEYGYYSLFWRHEYPTVLAPFNRRDGYVDRSGGSAKVTEEYTLTTTAYHYEDDPGGKFEAHLKEFWDFKVATTYCLSQLKAADLPKQRNFHGDIVLPNHPDLVGVIGGHLYHMAGKISDISWVIGQTSFFRPNLPDQNTSEYFGEFFELEGYTYVKDPHTGTYPDELYFAFMLSFGIVMDVLLPTKERIRVLKNNAGFKLKKSLTKIREEVAANDHETIKFSLGGTWLPYFSWYLTDDLIRELEITNDYIFVHMKPAASGSQAKAGYSEVTLIVSFKGDIKKLKDTGLGVSSSMMLIPDSGSPSNPVIYENWYVNDSRSDGGGSYAYEYKHLQRTYRAAVLTGCKDSLGGVYVPVEDKSVDQYYADAIIPFTKGNIVEPVTGKLKYQDKLYDGTPISPMREMARQGVWTKRRHTWDRTDDMWLREILYGNYFYDGGGDVPQNSKYNMLMRCVIFNDGRIGLVDRTKALTTRKVNQKDCILIIQPVLIDGTPIQYEAVDNADNIDNAFNVHRGASPVFGYIRQGGTLKPCQIFSQPWIVWKVNEPITPAPSGYIARYNATGTTQNPDIANNPYPSTYSNAIHVLNGHRRADPILGTIFSVWGSLNPATVGNKTHIPGHSRMCPNCGNLPSGRYKRTPTDPNSNYIEYNSYIPPKIGQYIPGEGSSFLWTETGKMAIVAEWFFNAQYYKDPLEFYSQQGVSIGGNIYGVYAPANWSYTFPASSDLPDDPPGFAPSRTKEGIFGTWYGDFTMYVNVTKPYGYSGSGSSSLTFMGSTLEVHWESGDATYSIKSDNGIIETGIGIDRTRDITYPSIAASMSLDPDHGSDSHFSYANAYGTTYKIYEERQGADIVVRQLRPVGYFHQGSIYATGYWNRPAKRFGPVPGGYDGPVINSDVWGNNAYADRLIESDDGIQNPMTWSTFCNPPCFAFLTDGVPLFVEAIHSDERPRNLVTFREDVDSRYFQRNVVMVLKGKTYKIVHIGGAHQKVINMDKGVGSISGADYKALNVGYDKVIVVDVANGIPVEIGVVVVDHEAMFTVGVSQNGTDYLWAKSNFIIQNSEPYTIHPYFRFRGDASLNIFNLGSVGAANGEGTNGMPPTDVKDQLYLWVDVLSQRPPYNTSYGNYTGYTWPEAYRNPYHEAYRTKHSVWKFKKGKVKKSVYQTTHMIVIDFSDGELPDPAVMPVIGSTVNGECRTANNYFVRDTTRKVFYLDLTKSIYDIPINVPYNSLWIGLRDQRLPGMLVKQALGFEIIKPAPGAPLDDPNHPGSVNPVVNPPGGGPTI